MWNAIISSKKMHERCKEIVQKNKINNPNRRKTESAKIN